ncbi:hypothetical protein BJ508DRAFT_322461 [Ascobolus immersus RN42]|uniref:Uncharacterized protein n=1 Tax=Ascobolus immersus RN42 TaxID=1160509 RepID=A0A3N4IJ41_ASCIM|nr:hypothetical protein BJ508DRAFT_322461 [Ascobolus immersus RN42]
MEDQVEATERVARQPAAPTSPCLSNSMNTVLGWVLAYHVQSRQPDWNPLQGPNPLDIIFSQLSPQGQKTRDLEKSADKSASGNTDNAVEATNPALSTPPPTYQPTVKLAGTHPSTSITRNAQATPSNVTIHLGSLPIGNFTHISGGMGTNSPVRRKWSDNKKLVWFLFFLAFTAGIVIPLAIFAHELKPHAHHHDYDGEDGEIIEVFHQ